MSEWKRVVEPGVAGFEPSAHEAFDGTMRRVKRRRRARTASVVALSFGLSAAAIGFLWHAWTRPSAVQVASEGTGSAIPSSSPSSTCEYGPWAQVCPEAEWVRSVLKDAGVPQVGDTGSALVAERGGEFYIWAEPIGEEPPLSQILSDFGYEHVQSVDGTAVYSDGVRSLWQVDGLYVWLQSGEDGYTISSDLIASLVLSSNRIPGPT